VGWGMEKKKREKWKGKEKFGSIPSVFSHYVHLTSQVGMTT
jgi:hypothetical protein